jgi:hypothetical protein
VSCLPSLDPEDIGIRSFRIWVYVTFRDTLVPEGDTLVPEGEEITNFPKRWETLNATAFHPRE